MNPSRVRFGLVLAAMLALALVVSREFFRSSPATESRSTGAPSPLAAPPSPVAATALPPAADVGPAPGAAAARAGTDSVPPAIVAFEDWLTTWRRADAAAQRVLAGAGRDLAVARRDALKELIRIDPRRALEFAVPVSLRRELPGEVVARLERRLDGRGDYEVVIGCFGPVTRIERSAVIDGQRYEVFTAGRRAEQHTKLGIPLHGIAVDDVAALAEDSFRLLDDGEKQALGLEAETMAANVGGAVQTFGSPAEWETAVARQVAAEAVPGPYVGGAGDPADGRPATAANTPWILGEKRVLWVQVDFSDDPGGVASPAQIEVTNGQVRTFYAAVSQGRTTMTFTVLPEVLRMPRPKSFYNASSTTTTQLHTDALAAAKAYDTAHGGTGIHDPDRYDRRIVLFKRMPAYAFGGLATLTGPRVWLNGTISPGTTYHELGHTQGLSHSHYWLPSGASGVGAGTHVEYGDVFDAMGSSSSSPHNHFNVAQKARLGYLENESIRTITEAGTYRLARHDHQDATGLRALLIAPEGLTYEYWVDHRRAGPTSFNAAQLDRLREGAHLHWGPNKAPAFASATSGTYLVDATPGSAGGANDAPLRIGESFVDPDAGVTIRPLAAGGSAPNEYLDVQIAFGAIDGNRNPVLQAALPAAALRARSNVIFTATASDPDNDPVYYRWDFGDRQLYPTLNNITRRFPKGGAYTLRVSAHDGRGGIDVRNLDLQVEDPLTTWTERTSGVTVTLLGVFRAAGRFFALGNGGFVLSSPDGVDWTRHPAGAASYGWYAGAHDGRRLVAVGVRVGAGNDRGGAVYSDDGETWTLAAVPSGVGQMLSVAQGAGRFVAVGEQGRIYLSTDGSNWAAVPSGITNTLRAVRFADGLFVACGDSGRILTSPDGETWTNRSVATGNALYGLTRHLGAWYASSLTLECFTSVDTRTWTRIATAGRTNNLWTMDSIGGLLFSTTANGSIAFAEDARSWTAHQLNSTTGTTLYGVAEGDGTLVVVGSRGLIYTAAAVAPGVPPLTPPSLRNEADSLKVAVGRKNVLAAGGAGFVKLELYANGTKVSELNGSAGAFVWTPAAIGNYSLSVRGVTATGESVVSAEVPALAALPTWEWCNPAIAGNNLRGAVRVDGKWWVVGQSGTLLTVDAAGGLTPISFPTTQHLSGISHAKGRFVVSGPYADAGSREEIGSLWTSTDGYAWTPLLTTVFDNFNLNFVAFGGDQWLTASTGGLILTSADGLNWVRQNSGVTNSLRAAAFGNGTWVVVGANGRALTSPDGVTWTVRATGFSGDLNGIAFRGEQFVAAGSGGAILTSGDGVNWARQNSGVTGVLNTVGFVGGTCVIGGDAGLVLHSPNLTVWTRGTLGGGVTPTILFAGGSGGDGILLGRAGEVFTSADPATWKRLSQGTVDHRTAVIHGGGRFVAVGWATDTRTEISSTPVMISTNGVTWTRAAANPALAVPDLVLNAIAFGRGTYVTVSDEGAIFTSTDANAWTTRTSPVSTSLNAVCAGAEGFVAVGNSGRIVSSATGETWAAATSGVSGGLHAVAFGNGRYVAVGDSGTILHSADAQTWTRATSGVSAALITAGWWDNVGFVVAGNSGTILSSVDGVTWQQQESGVADPILALTRTRIGLVAAVGTNGTLLTSLDGVSWSTASLPVDRAIRSLAASDAAIVAVGDLGATLAFSFVDATPAPLIAAQPRSQTVGAGNAVTLSVDARHTTGAVFQWARDGRPIVGANSPIYVIPAVDSARTGSYTVTITSPTGSVTSAPAVVALGAATNPGRLVNLSILTSLQSAADALVVGVVVGGPGTSGAKPVLVRAAGPALVSLGIEAASVLQDPRLEVFSGSAKVGENDNWGGEEPLRLAMAQVGAFPYASANSRDAAIALPGVAPGPNSIRISGTGAGTFIAELYDATPTGGFTATTPRLVNVSVLKHLGTGLTAGFVLGGSASRTVLVRAIGPTLGAAPFNVPETVVDPRLELFAGQASVGTNDNWGGGAALVNAFAQVGAFALPTGSRDAALLVTLAPGSYTVQVGGVGGTTGVALVEIYEVP
jgi:hypothetical protein